MDPDSGHPGRPRVVTPLASTRLKTPGRDLAPPRPIRTEGAVTADARALQNPRRWRNLSAWAATEGTLRVVAVPREAWTPFFERLVLERETGLPRSTPSAR